MTDELILKSEVLKLIDDLDISDGQVYDDLLFNIEDMTGKSIKKSEVLDLIDSLNISDRQTYDDLTLNVENMTPVKSLEIS